MSSMLARFRVSPLALLVPMALAAALVCGCSSGEELDMGGRAPIPLSEVNQGTFADDALPVVLRISAGDTIPVKLDMQVGFAELQPGANQMRFNREVLLYISRDKELYISPNGQRWAPIHDLEAVKDVFGFEEGEASIGLSVTEETGPQLNLAIGLHQGE